MLPKSRTPQGVRGLKFLMVRPFEIVTRRTPQGVRGLKYIAELVVREEAGRTPQGVRGLKSLECVELFPAWESHPARGAWIEMSSVSGLPCKVLVAPRKGCVD